MKRLIELMKQKNHYLEKFYALNESEIVQFTQGMFEGLDSFYGTRENILSVIRYIDAQIEETNLEIPSGTTPTVIERQELQDHLNIKDEYVARILQQDLQILSCIEMTKNTIIRELQEVRRNRKALKGYKVRQHQPRLDEEA